MQRSINSIELREKAAMTTVYVMATNSLYSDDDNTEDTDQDFSSTGANEDQEWMARKFTPTADGYISAISVYLGKTGSPAGTIYMEVYTDDGETVSMPSAIVSGSASSDSRTSNDFASGAGGQQETFRWSRGCPKVRAGVSYWAVMKTVGYTYADGVTEIRWRTDADGATGLNECAKYDANASTTWTTVGANVGADIEVDVAKEIPIADCNSLVLSVDFTIGSATTGDIKLEFSENGEDWDSYCTSAISAGVETVTLTEFALAASGYYQIGPIAVANRLARVSAKVTGTTTNAQMGITGIMSAR